jgi:radical SAM superfamily enzyme YgiQ (UPF0313 family)
MIVEPLELEVLAALIKDPDEPVIADLIIDGRPLEWFLRSHRPAMVCVTGYITNVPAMIDVCTRSKAYDPSIITVVGGVHCEVCPGDFDHPAVDYRVVRNPVLAFPALIAHVRGDVLPAGVLPRGAAADGNLPPFDFTFVPPRRDLTKEHRGRYFYIFHDKVALLKTAFGCPHTCSFCFCTEITGHHYVERPIDDVMDELEGIAENEIYIVDDDFLVSRARVVSFLDGLEARRIRKHYLLYGRADFIARNPDLVGRFAGLGLRTVIIGVESFAQDELASYDKRITVEENRRALEILKKRRVDTYVTLIIPPHWTAEDFSRCGDELIRSGVLYVNLQPYTPLPGTGSSVRDEDLLIGRGDFEKWDLAHVTVRPLHMSAREFYRQIILLYRRILLRPYALVRHAVRYPPRMWLKMIAGTRAVWRQYDAKMREA